MAIVAADHPETARRAADRIEVDYEELEPLVDPEYALLARLAAAAPRREPAAPRPHRARRRSRGEADVVVTGEYEVGMQDQAFLGPESGLAVPAEDGGIDLFIATQWLHVDRDQVAAALGSAASRRCGSRSRASAARSAGARTSRCRSTRACSRCTRAGR